MEMGTTRNALLVESTISIESRGDRVHFSDQSGAVHIAIPRELFLATLDRANQIPLEWARGASGTNIIPLCELCVRHNLPRHEH